MVVHGTPCRGLGCFAVTILRNVRAPYEVRTDTVQKRRRRTIVAEERAEPKVVLLVRLLNAIDEGRFTFEELKDQIADEKPPSTRTLRRYLSVLADAGFPWFFDRASGTYRFAE